MAACERNAALLRGGRIAARLASVIAALLWDNGTAKRLLASVGCQLLLSGGMTEPAGPPYPLITQLLPLMRSGGMDASLVALE